MPNMYHDMLKLQFNVSKLELLGYGDIATDKFTLDVMLVHTITLEWIDPVMPDSQHSISYGISIALSLTFKFIFYLY